MVKEVDARGLPCPRPVIETRKALEEAQEEAIAVLVDSKESCENVQRFARSQGCQVTVSEKEGVFRLDIVGGLQVQADAGEGGGVVVLVGTDRLGTGDSRLGEILMKSFLNTLWDYEPKPARLIFMNDGVKLTTEGSEVLDTLKLLEKEGVPIFSCGTCLEYYGLTQKLSVGQVTNMYDTVDALLSAARVINV